MQPTRRITVARIMRPKGVRGNVLAQLMTHRRERFNDISAVVIQRAGAEDLELRLQCWRPDGDRVLLKFVGIDTPEDAKALLAGGYVTVAPDEVPPLPPNTYYVFDLVGCTVLDEAGSRLGELTGVLEMPSTDVYQVRGSAGEILIPAVGDFVVDVRPQDGVIVVRGVEDLLSAM